MSINIYEIHIQTDRLDKVKDYLVSWLNHTYEEELVVENGQDSSFSFFNHMTPQLFAVSILHQNWITILHDSYEPPLELANKLSSTFSSTVIQAMGQSTIDTYYLSVHQEGTMIRKIHCGEDTIGIEQEGNPFPFEKSLSQNNDEDHFFDYEDMSDFCENFRIDLLMDPAEKDGQWTFIMVKEKTVQNKETFFKKLSKYFT